MDLLPFRMTSNRFGSQVLTYTTRGKITKRSLRGALTSQAVTVRTGIVTLHDTEVAKLLDWLVGQNRYFRHGGAMLVADIPNFGHWEILAGNCIGVKRARAHWLHLRAIDALRHHFDGPGRVSRKSVRAAAEELRRGYLELLKDLG